MGRECQNIGKIDCKKITLFHQAIVDVQTGTRDKFMEILCREGGMSVYGKLLEFTQEEKVRFDYVILEKFLQAYMRISHETTYHINIDPVTFTHPSFVDDVKALLEKYNFTDIENLSLEVTENGSMTPAQIHLLDVSIQRLRSEIGIRLGIDDFPNENNNNELLDMIGDIDYVKIDKGFALDHKKGAVSQDDFIKGIQGLIDIVTSKKGNIPLIIEGIEDEYLFELVEYHFKDQIKYHQGYHFQIPKKLEPIPLVS